MSDAPSTETETTTTEPEGLGDAGQRALKAERERAKAAEARAAAAEKRLAEIETANLRADVAASKGLPDALVGRLSGSTREELEADADALLEAVKPAEEETTSAPRSRPVERLRSGAVGGIEPGPSMGDVAAAVLRG
jgi:hypothetical protein